VKSKQTTNMLLLITSRKQNDVGRHETNCKSLPWKRGKINWNKPNMQARDIASAWTQWEESF